MSDQVIENPTYMEHIRHFFDEVDLAHSRVLHSGVSTRRHQCLFHCLESHLFVKDIDRIKIPGSFRALIEAGGKVVARKTFFQSMNPGECDNCRDRAKINLDFVVDIADIEGKALMPRIKVLNPEPGLGHNVPLHSCGSPTLNIQQLIQTDYRGVTHN